MNPSATSKSWSRNYRLRSVFAIAAALAITPGFRAQENDSARLRLSALALEQQGQNSEAEGLWNSILSADPRNAEALAHIGLLEARQERYDTAIEHYHRAAAIDPNLPGLQMNLGLALFKAGQFPDAIRSFSSEIRKHPGDQRLTILLAMAHYGMKDYLVAIPYLQQALQRDQANLTLHLTLARSCMLSKQYKCVVDEHDALRLLHSDSPEADLLAAEALDKLNRPQQAIAELNAAIQSHPDESNLHFALGYLLWSEAKWSEAAGEFQLDLQSNPEHTRGRLYLADCLLRQNEPSAALADFEKVEPKDRSEPLLHLDLGIVFLNSNRIDDALRELKTAAESDPDNAEPHRQMARLYQSIGRIDDSKKESALANRISPSHHALEEALESPSP